MFTTLKTNPIEYVSLYDPAVDDSKMTTDQVKKYAETRDVSLLPIRPGCKPVTWVLFPLDPYTLRYAIGSTPRKPDETLMSDMFSYHLTQVGLRECKDLPSDAPVLTTRKVGMLEKVDDAFVKSIPPEIVRELGSVIYSISTVSGALRKNSNLPSDEAKSKGESTATPVVSEAK